ncbi:pyridoxal phosphate-dependent transferase [Diaporthe sp. PMI_573]|nr:pyridoxal phosphate-dependent transferase [Diaporthaceae sp. PMI_573]
MDSAQNVFNISHLFSNRIQRWQAGAIRGLLPLESLPGMISLVPGKPNPSNFPFSGLSLMVRASGSKPDTIIRLNDGEVSDAFQYNLPGGYPALVEWFQKLQLRVHGLTAASGWSCCVGNGSQDLIHKSFQVFTDPGDPILIESGIIGFLKVDGHELVEVSTDEEGIIPLDLETILTHWPTNSPRPRVIYTVPTGSNPTGVSCTESRKREILRLAKRFDLIIFEDDAYYFLDYRHKPARTGRSYLSLEREVNLETGRVVRFDSLSKIVSAGMRIGFLTGPEPVVQLVSRVTENTSLQPCTTTQVIAMSLFRHWRHDGFLSHCRVAAEFYRRRRDLFCLAAEKHLRDLASWNSPSAGLFLWLRLRLPPSWNSFDLMGRFSLDVGILAIPGAAFLPNGRNSCELRVSFSLITEGEMEEACARLASLVEQAWADYVHIANGALATFVANASPEKAR